MNLIPQTIIAPPPPGMHPSHVHQWSQGLSSIPPGTHPCEPNSRDYHRPPPPPPLGMHPSHVHQSWSQELSCITPRTHPCEPNSRDYHHPPPLGMHPSHVHQWSQELSSIPPGTHPWLPPCSPNSIDNSIVHLIIGMKGDCHIPSWGHLILCCPDILNCF